MAKNTKDPRDARLPEDTQKLYALSVRLARDEAERAALWAGRKGAFAAIGRLTPDYYTVDGVVPRTKLPATLARIQEISRESGFRIANVFHAGDGNLHPLIMWDSDVAGAEERVIDAGAEIMQICAAAGGSLSGEHGIGMEKKDLMPLIFSQDDVAQMLKIKAAMDPAGLCNPGKMFPGGEAPALQQHGLHPLEKAGVISRE